MTRVAELIQHLDFAIRHGTSVPVSFLREVREELSRLSRAGQDGGELRPTKVAVLDPQASGPASSVAQ